MSPGLATLLCVLFLGLSVNAFSQPADGMGARPDFSPAAESLGVSVEVLTSALRMGEPGPPDFAGASEKLGISEEKLRAVMPPPPESGSPE